MWYGIEETSFFIVHFLFPVQLLYSVHVAGHVYMLQCILYMYNQNLVTIFMLNTRYHHLLQYFTVTNSIECCFYYY